MNTILSNAEGTADRKQAIGRALASLVSLCGPEAGGRAPRMKLLSLQEKLASSRFHIAVLGQMKRGKSSLINALLGAEILPAGVLPLTAAITELRYAERPEATVTYTTGQRRNISILELSGYLTETGNPENSKQVELVEVRYPSALLKGGAVLMDTPGIGSTHRHNTRTTERWLGKIDAAIVVFSMDPPITQAECDFLRRVKDDIPKVFFILNKIDLATPAEVSMLRGFLLRELQDRLQFEAPEVFPLSAREALAGERDALDSAAHGMRKFNDRLRRFLTEEKESVLVRSVALDAIAAAGALRFALSIGVRAESLSLEDLAGKERALQEAVAQAELELGEIQAAIRGRAADLPAQIEQHLASRVESALPDLRQRLKSFRSMHPGETGKILGRLLEDFLMQAVEDTFRGWRVQEDAWMERELHRFADRFNSEANKVLERLQQAASALFAVPAPGISIVCGLDVESHVRYQVDRIFHSLDKFILLLPSFLLRPIVYRKVRKNLWAVLDRNSGRIRCDYVERMGKSIADFERNLHATASVVTESLTSALRAPASGAQGQEAALELLDRVIEDCRRLAR